MAKSPSKKDSLATKSKQPSNYTTESGKSQDGNSGKVPVTLDDIHSATDTPVGFRSSFRSNREKVWKKKRPHLHLHRSFHRSYREDYARPLQIPGLLHHAINTFQVIFKNWRLFLPFIILAVCLNILLVGLMSEDTYLEFQDVLDETSEQLSVGQLNDLAKSGLLLLSTITTGGLTQGATEVEQVFMIIIFLITWLVTIYILRHRLAGHTIKLRDALYNALTPLISTLCVFIVMFIQAIPLFIVIIAYSAAIATNFLATPFYALVFFIFAALLIILSAYLLSSSFIALVAVSAPGLYPMVALRTASDLIASRRTKLIIRLLYLVFVVAVIYIIIMLPIILLDLALKGGIDWLSGIPIVPFFLLCVTCFAFIYATAYCYLLYRRILSYDQTNK